MCIDENLRKAYENTEYRVFTPGFSIRIGREHPELDAWLDTQEADRWAFLTACNPASRLHSAHENKRRQAKLIERLTEAGYSHWEGEGAAIKGDWPPEDSVLVVRISEAVALEYARAFGQLAFLFGEKGKAAQLVLTGCQEVCAEKS